MKIIVESEEEKQKLLEQSEYIHDFMFECGKQWIGLDSDKAGTLMHLYMAPDTIIVKQKIDVSSLEASTKPICTFCHEEIHDDANFTEDGEDCHSSCLGYYEFCKTENQDTQEF